MIGPIESRPFAPFPVVYQMRGFLSAAENAGLLRYTTSREGNFIPTTVTSASHQGRDAHHRSSKKLPKGLGEWKPLLRQRFARVFLEVSKEVGLKQDTFERIELEVVAHNDGDRFGRHIDTLYYGLDRSAKTTRFLSSVYYYFEEPRGFTGGELRLYPFGSLSPPGHFSDILPENNMAVFFPAFAAHEVLPIHCPSRAFSASRFAVNCWFHRPLEQHADRPDKQA